MSLPFSWGRAIAITLKEFVQMRRDRLTFAMMIGIPIIQLALFGYAINTDPKDLPVALYAADDGPYARALVAAMENSGYFRIERVLRSSGEGRRMLESGDALFAVTIPAGFSRAIDRGETGGLLIEADASDPVAGANALAAMQQIAGTALRHDLRGQPATAPPPLEITVHRLYNPEGVSQYNIVPGLLGVILTMTLVLITAIAMTRERERGTLENLLAMPLNASEVMIGKIVPYIAVGAIQVVIVLLAARFVFGVPFVGSLAVLTAGIAVFIVTNLAVGFTISTLAQTQMQAMQMTFFIFLPSILLSGFMFPFAGMPEWAQAIGEALPLTHFLRIVRAVLLKGAGADDVVWDIVPLGIIMAVVSTIALLRYRRTLD